jgi:hypothetical protein
MSPTRERIAIEQLRAEAARPVIPRNNRGPQGPRGPRTKPWTGAYEIRRLRHLVATGRGATVDANDLRIRIARMRKSGEIQPRERRP